MRHEEIAERSRAAAAENNELVLGALVAAGDAGLRPGELVVRVELPERTVRDAVNRLEARGLVQREGKKRLWATTAGRSEAGAGTPGLALAPTLDVAIDCFPSEAQRAFVRLLLAAVPARWHLAGDHADGWAGFIAFGPSKTGKTSIAKLACRLYGLDELQAIKLAQDETPGSLVARRERDRDTRTGYRVERSPLLELAFACIDEWDKAAEPVRAAASRLLLGHTATELEGERLQLRPTVLVCLNTGPAEGLRVLHDAHVRRSVVLNTTPLVGLLADVDERMHRLFQETPLPSLPLERLKPARALPPELRQLLRVELRAGLTEDGWTLSDVEPLARIALGRAALTELPLEQAVLATVLDYLTCAATLGHARQGFAARLAAQLGGRGAMLPNAAAAEAELEAARERRRALRLRELDELTARRAELVASLRLAEQDLDARRLPRDRKVAGAGIRATLRKLREEAGQARAAETLADVDARAQARLEDARELLEAIATEKESAARARTEAERARRAMAAAARADKTAMRRQLDELRSRARELERLYRRRRTEPGEVPLVALGRLRVVTYERLERQPRQGLGALVDLFDSGERGWWHAPSSPGISFLGTTAGVPPELEHWGEGTRELLAAALAPLYARERELERRLSLSARRTRVPLPSANPQSTVVTLRTRRSV